MKQKDENHSMPLLKYLWLTWKEETYRRKKCCKILENAITKTLLQTAWTEINKFKRDLDYTDKVDDKTTRLFKMLNRRLLHDGFTAWRQHNYHRTVFIEAAANKQLIQEVQTT